MKPRARRRAAAVATLVLLPVVWWVPLLIGTLPDFMDTVTQFYPMRLAAARQIADGTLPLWLPNIFSGVPLAANPQIAVWYPPQVLFYLWPGPVSWGLLCVLHYVWGGFGAYWYVRRMTGSIGAALFAAVTFQFSAMLVSRIALLPHVYTTVWVPWMLLAVERAIAEGGFRPRWGALGVAACFAMQLLAGAPQVSYFTALMLPVYWIARAVSDSPRKKWGRSIAGAAVQGLAAALLAAAIAAIQLLPTLEFLRQAERSTIPLERLRETALNGPFILRAFFGFTGNPVEDTDTINAIGPGAMLLVLVALARARRRRHAVPLMLVAAAAFLLSLGALVPLWAKLLPLYDGFHAPRRALIFWTIAGSLTAGFGAAHLDTIWRRRRLPRHFFAALLILLTAGTWWMLFRLEREFTTTDRFQPHGEVLAALGTDRYITLDPTFNYSYGSRHPEYGRSLMPDLACWHDVHDANGYDPLVPARYGLARRLASERSGVFYPSHGVFLTDPNSPLLRLLNVQYLIGRFDLFDPGRVIPGTAIDHARLHDAVDLVHEDDYWPLYRYREARPLAWAVQEAVAVDNAESALRTALGVNDPHRIAFIEEPLFLRAAGPVPAAEATYADARTVAVTLAEPATEETFVCVAVSWMPGWRARAGDGQRLLAMPANGVIAGVLVPPGVQEFTLRYAPSSFLRGGLLSLGGLLLAAGWALRLRRLPIPSHP